VLYDELKAPNGTFNGKDITMWVYRSGVRQQFQCLQDTVTVGFIDTITIGCVASDVVLYVSLVFIIGVVAIKFCMAVIFGWFLSWKLGAFKGESYQQRMARAAEIEQWTDDIYRPAPSRYRPNVPVTNASKEKRKTQFFPTTSRFSRADLMAKSPTSRPATTYGTTDANYRRTNVPSMYGGKTHSPSRLTPPDASSLFRGSRSSTSLEGSNGKPSNSDPNLASCPFPLRNVVPQPPPDFEPFNFPLAHTICLVTAYSESLEGLRTTLDSLATTDYPNSHKLIMVIADGMVKGSGNVLTTPEIVLSMMKELVVDKEDVEAHSYVAIADGHKRHNMAKVYAGFYDYDDNTVEPSKQQRVPIVLVAKCGNPLEISDPKPGNRGKRDSQIVLMAFLQKVMFDERMTTFEYEFFNSIWRVTGVSPDRYELVLCVDADTKVFPDSLTRMTACMVHDEEIMGLCGETKIANKAETWVTMIQGSLISRRPCQVIRPNFCYTVFEYYISHHLTKAFESMFGGVTCLPGCFSMYRIKVAKGDSGYWVPILANPDIVEHYSENIVDTLHKKNLLLLGEDRYLSTLMLKTFPKRKMIFCPQAVCKTMVPDTFGVLLSQRRRWINSTIHNLAELLFVRDLCGTFCFSMQFVVFMELTGTLVLPAAISFTIYLIIISIIQHGSKTLIPLILLGIILGLPGVLIVVTSRKIAYVGWMLAYLFALPVWNFMLPAYAFWHFDDFSWGQTRLVAGDKLGGEGDKDGEFDSSHIVMKRWAEFERERRWKSGTQSRDSMYDVVHRKGSPKLFVYFTLFRLRRKLTSAVGLRALGIRWDPRRRLSTTSTPQVHPVNLSSHSSPRHRISTPKAAAHSIPPAAPLHYSCYPLHWPFLVARTTPRPRNRQMRRSRRTILRKPAPSAV
jgi:chitin synthase